MSQSLLYYAFGIPSRYRYLHAEYREGAVWFAVRSEVEPECCPHCQSRELGGHGQRERNVRTVPIGLKAVWLKEELGLGWEQSSREAMADFFCACCEKAIASGIKQLIGSGRRSRNGMIAAR